MKNKAALKISGIYFIIGFIWILFSDKLTELFSDDRQTVIHLQTYKGWFFVFATAALIYILIRDEILRKNKIEIELKQAKQKAEESDRLKTAFLSNMSHEIRTPLNGILGFSSLLEDDYYSPSEKSEFIQQIHQNGNDLMVLINDIIDISKIQENQLSIHLVEFDLHALLDSLYEHFNHVYFIAHQSQVRFILEKGSGSPQFKIVSDPDRLKQVLTNLINNAIHYTRSGFIKYGYKKNESSIDFFVEDSGMGIKRENTKAIFERFYQANHPYSNNVKGFGLGLPISKGLVDLLGGTLQLHSEYGKGSCFFFSLPLMAQKRAGMHN
jgi:signal transduction histidine kinase